MEATFSSKLGWNLRLNFRGNEESWAGWPCAPRLF